MNLKQYITVNGHGSAARLAKQANINRLYLSQITTGKRKPSPAMATGFSVSIESLRPDIAEMFREQGATNLESPNGKEATSAGSGDTVTPTNMEGGAATESSAQKPIEH